MQEYDLHFKNKKGGTMHYVIGLITALAGLLWALNALQRSGFRLSSLNPFLLYRRMKWEKEYGTKPLYRLDSAQDVAAVLLLGTAKCDGEISSNQKKKILSIFIDEFAMSKDDAADLLVAASFLIRNEVYIVDSLSRILARSRNKFTESQKRSLIAFMEEVAQLDGGPNAESRKLIAKTAQIFA